MIGSVVFGTFHVYLLGVSIGHGRPLNVAVVLHCRLLLLSSRMRINYLYLDHAIIFGAKYMAKCHVAIVVVAVTCWSMRHTVPVSYLANRAHWPYPRHRVHIHMLQRVMNMDHLWILSVLVQ